MKKGLMICCLLLWGGFIFYQGSRSVTVSQGISDHFVNRAVILVQKCLPSMNAATIYQILNVAIRKLAHFTEYALLGGGLFCYFKCHGQSKGNQWIYSLFIVLLLATFDEYVQLFVGRTSSVRDVLIDLAGGIGGVSVMTFMIKMIEVSKSFLKTKNSFS